MSKKITECLTSAARSRANGDQLEKRLSNPNLFSQEDLAYFISELWSKGVIPSEYYTQP